MAMRACREESSNLLQNRQEMHHVKEVDNDGYCDISGFSQNMRLIGERHFLISRHSLLKVLQVQSDRSKYLLLKVFRVSRIFLCYSMSFDLLQMYLKRRHKLFSK